MRSTFQRWPRTPTFAEGARIPLLVDPANPRSAIPIALFADRRAAQIPSVTR